MARKVARRTAPIPPVVLRETLDLPAATPLAAQLLARRGQDLNIDAGGTLRMGAQCLQVLLSARATWASDGQVFRVVRTSPEFAAAVALLGAGDLAVVTPDPAEAPPVPARRSASRGAPAPAPDQSAPDQSAPDQSTADHLDGPANPLATALAAGDASPDHVTADLATADLSAVQAA
jgi:chemotaxis protein CheX